MGGRVHSGLAGVMSVRIYVHRSVVYFFPSINPCIHPSTHQSINQTINQLVVYFSDARRPARMAAEHSHAATRNCSGHTATVTRAMHRPAVCVVCLSYYIYQGHVCGLCIVIPPADGLVMATCGCVCGQSEGRCIRRGYVVRSMDE